MLSQHDEMEWVSPGWEPAFPGEIRQLGQTLRLRRRRRRFIRSIAVAATALLAGAGATWMWSGCAENDAGGITCSEVASRHNASPRGDLTDEERNRIQQHFAQCPRCRLYYWVRGTARL